MVIAGEAYVYTEREGDTGVYLHWDMLVEEVGGAENVPLYSGSFKRGSSSSSPERMCQRRSRPWCLRCLWCLCCLSCLWCLWRQAPLLRHPEVPLLPPQRRCALYASGLLEGYAPAHGQAIKLNVAGIVVLWSPAASHQPPVSSQRPSPADNRVYSLPHKRHMARQWGRRTTSLPSRTARWKSSSLGANDRTHCPMVERRLQAFGISRVCGRMRWSASISWRRRMRPIRLRI